MEKNGAHPGLGRPTTLGTGPTRRGAGRDLASVPSMTGARFAFLDHDGPIAFAHRGGGLEGFENTWAAFSQARDLGYRYMETDVNATSDGVVVTFHDPYLHRVTDGGGLVREMTWRDLARVRLHSGDAIPRLDELLAAWPETRWNIDTKHDSAVDPLIETVRRADAIDRVCITSFSDRRIARLRRELGPRVCMSLGAASVASLRLASVLPGPAAERTVGILRRFGAAQVPMRQWSAPVVDSRFVTTAHRLGLQVHVWTIDDRASMVRLLELGVDGIMTDRPSLLKEVLQQRQAWS
jgi:glycerophosphoryl diester phosphodiesterase